MLIVEWLPPLNAPVVRITNPALRGQDAAIYRVFAESIEIVESPFLAVWTSMAEFLIGQLQLATTMGRFRVSARSA